jgi:hypothetical protein
MCRLGGGLKMRGRIRCLDQEITHPHFLRLRIRLRMLLLEGVEKVQVRIDWSIHRGKMGAVVDLECMIMSIRK